MITSLPTFSSISSLESNSEGKASINIPKLKQALLNNERPSLYSIIRLIVQFENIVENEPNVVYMDDPVTIVSDIHGQFRDLLKILSLKDNRNPTYKFYQLVFLGDYVDRGYQGIEVLIMLMSLKTKYPQHVIMLRGNHYSRQITQQFNFFKYACYKYSQDIYFRLMDCFDRLPLACIVNNKYFCVHGGISPDTMTIKSINWINRAVEVPAEGAHCDLIWSDPIPNQQGTLSNPLGSTIKTKLMFNHMRCCSIFYGAVLSHYFLRLNSLKMIIRGHEVQNEGYKQHIWPGWNNIPTVYTLFSAPNYCGTYGNMGAILQIHKDYFVIRQFKYENPYCYLPAKYDAFNFSMSKLATIVRDVCLKLTQMSTSQIKYLNEVPTDQIVHLLLSYSHANKTPYLFSEYQLRSSKTDLNPKPMDFKHFMKYIYKTDTTEPDNFRKSLFLNSYSYKRPSTSLYRSTISIDNS